MSSSLSHLPSLSLSDVSGFLGNTRYYADIVSEVAAKRQNFETSITDYWALSCEAFPIPHHPVARDLLLTAARSLVSKCPTTSSPANTARLRRPT